MNFVKKSRSMLRNLSNEIKSYLDDDLSYYEKLKIKNFLRSIRFPDYIIWDEQFKNQQLSKDNINVSPYSISVYDDYTKLSIFWTNFSIMKYSKYDGYVILDDFIRHEINPSCIGYSTYNCTLYITKIFFYCEKENGMPDYVQIIFNKDLVNCFGADEVTNTGFITYKYSQ